AFHPGEGRKLPMPNHSGVRRMMQNVLTIPRPAVQHAPGIRPGASIPQRTAGPVVVRSIDEIERIRQRWIDLRQQSGCASLNNDFDRYLATLRSMGADVRPHVVMIGHDDDAALVIGRTHTHSEACRVGYFRIPEPPLRTLDIVYGGIIRGPGSMR